MGSSLHTLLVFVYQASIDEWVGVCMYDCVYVCVTGTWFIPQVPASSDNRLKVKVIRPSFIPANTTSSRHELLIPLPILSRDRCVLCVHCATVLTDASVMCHHRIPRLTAHTALHPCCVARITVGRGRHYYWLSLFCRSNQLNRSWGISSHWKCTTSCVCIVLNCVQWFYQWLFLSDWSVW